MRKSCIILMRHGVHVQCHVQCHVHVEGHTASVCVCVYLSNTIQHTVLPVRVKSLAFV